MKVKTSITLTENTLREVDEAAGSEGSRSRLIETAVLEYLDRRRRQSREARDRRILDTKADVLNRDAEDVLAYQADV